MVTRDTRPERDASGSARAARDALDWVREQLTGAAAPIDAMLAHASGTVAILLETYDDQASVQAAALAGAADLLDGDRIEQRFGLAVRRLVDSVSQISRLRELFRAPGAGASAADLETLRRMTLALASDIRVVLIRLASRLQTLRSHARSKTPPDSAIARETLDVLAPLANRLGIWQMKWELEDLAFRFLQPEDYRQLAGQLEQRRVEREAFLRASCVELTRLLAEHGVRGDVSWRPKHIYSIYSKMRAKNIGLAQVLDLRAIRIIVADVKDCYAALAVVHQRWQSIPSEFDDYIARPKSNGYQSLHTVVTADDGRALEIQVRTADMHRAAEYGLAAHWVYKERSLGQSGAAQARAGELQQLAWLRELLAWQQDVGNRMSAPVPDAPSAPASQAGVPQAGAPPATEPPRRDAAARIFVITPQGRVVELPADSTPVDFAYHVHTDLGHRCRGARVDGQMVPLNTPLRNAQVVDIVTTRRGQETSGPSRDWLNPGLGYLRSSRARTKVRQWFAAQDQALTIASGRERIERQMQREGKTALAFDTLSARLGFADANAMFLAAARDELGPRAIELALRDQLAAPARTATPDRSAPASRSGLVRPSTGPGPGSGTAEPERAARPAPEAASAKGAVLIVGVDSLLTQLAQCCRPLPPDAIVGFVTRGRGISVHRRECRSFARLREVAAERVVAASWGKPQARSDVRPYVAELVLKTSDRVGIMRDLLDACARSRNAVSDSGVAGSRHDHLVRLLVQVADNADLESLMATLGAVNGVLSVRRKPA